MRRISLKGITLLSSSIPDGIYEGVPIAGWDSSSAYAAGTLVSYTDHYVYRAKSSVASDGQSPPSATGSWQFAGALDRWAMFEPILRKFSQSEGFIEVEVDVSSADVIGLFNLTGCVSVDFELRRAGELKRKETVDLKRPGIVAGWYSWLFSGLTTESKLLWQFPKYTSATLTLRLNGHPGESVSCGFCSPGLLQDIAATQRGLSASLIDYSYAPFSGGLVTITPGGSADDLSVSLMIPTVQVGSVRDIFYRGSGKPAIFDLRDSGDPDLLVVALLKKFERVYSFREWTRCVLTLNGLI